MKTKKIVIDATAFSSQKAYGFQEYLFNLLEYFYVNNNEFKCRELYIICDTKEEKSFSKYSNFFIIKSYKCDSYFKRFLLLENIHKKLNLCKNDIILYTANYGSLSKKTKQIVVVHDTLFLHKEMFLNNWHTFLFRIQRKFYFMFSLKNADFVIAISDFTKKEILHNYKIPENKVIRIYNYFNFNKFLGVAEYGLIKNPFFLAVSSSAYHKNIKLILDSFYEYSKKSNSKNQLVIVGNMNNFINKYISSFPSEVQDKILILKHLQSSQLSYLYQNAECYISASRYEGLGMPIVEAMYFNLKLLIFDTEIHREVTSNIGLFFSKKDELVRILKDLDRLENILDYTNIISAKYSDISTSKKYIELLNQISN